MGQIGYEKMIEGILINFFHEHQIKYEQKDNFHELLNQYFNFLLRYIKIEKRNIRVSNELSSVIKTHPKKEALFDIFYKIAIGVNINDYQSKKLYDATYNDDMFNDWGIHHLHLSIEKEKDNRFYKRSKYLVFIRFLNDTAYFIDILDHNAENKYSNTNILRIIRKNWPDTLKPISNHKWYPDLNDSDYFTIRKKGYTSSINVDGEAFLQINHGYMSTGINGQAVHMSGEVIRWCYKNKELYRYRPDDFKNALYNELYMSYKMTT